MIRFILTLSRIILVSYQVWLGPIRPTRPVTIYIQNVLVKLSYEMLEMMILDKIFNSI